MKTKISLRGVSKDFGPGLRVLQDISLDVREGEFLCVLGPSGCGKTTLLRILAGLCDPSEGSVSRPGAAPGRLQNSLLFQDLALFPWRTVRENVALGLEFQPGKRQHRDEAVARHIRQVRLEGFENSYPHQLSGGMAQRAALARALASDPEVLMLDEPLGSLDAAMRRLLQEELLALCAQNRRTAVMVTHSIEEALLLGDRIVLLTAAPGRIKADIPSPFTGPRSAGLTATPGFASLSAEVWRLLREELRAA